MDFLVGCRVSSPNIKEYDLDFKMNTLKSLLHHITEYPLELKGHSHNSDGW